MGQACCCEKYRPRYKHHVRAAVYDGKTSDLGEYAFRIRTQLPSISRYLKKQVENNMNNRSRIKNAMASWDELITNCHEDLTVFEITLLDVIELVLKNGYQNANTDYLTYGMHTLQTMLPHIKNKPFPHNRFNDFYEILIKACSFDMNDVTVTSFSPNHPLSSSLVLHKDTINLSTRTYSVSTRARFKREESNGNDKIVHKHSLLTLELLISNCSKEVTQRHFEVLMQLFLHFMKEITDRSASINESKYEDSKHNESFEQNEEAVDAIATRCFRSLCGWISSYSMKEMNSFLECLLLDFQWDIAFSNRTLLIALREGKSSGFELAKAVVDMLLRVDNLSIPDLEKVQIKIRMLKSLIEFSKHIEKNRNPYEIISKLCNLFGWLEHIPVTFSPSIRICCTAAFNEQISPSRDKDRTDRTDSQLDPVLSGDESSGNDEVNDIKNSEYTNGTHEHHHNSSTKRKKEKKKSYVDNGGGNGEDTSGDLINNQFRLANACLKCISEYVSYHDVHPILQRAILPRLQKASGFHHKKYLLYAALETALRRRPSTRTRPLNDHILRIVLQCPLKERQVRNELNELSQLLIQNLLLPLYNVRYDSEDPQIYRTNIQLFESQLGQKENPIIIHMDFEHKKWMYAIFYKECQNYMPNEILKAFAMTIVLTFYCIRNWAEELLEILPFLRGLEEMALSLEGEDSNHDYGIALHTVVLSLVMLLVQNLKHSRYQQELWSRCQEIRTYRQANNQILSTFGLDNFGRIELEGKSISNLGMPPKLAQQESVLEIATANSMGDFFDEPSVTMTGTTTEMLSAQLSPNQRGGGFPAKSGANTLVVTNTGHKGSNVDLRATQNFEEHHHRESGEIFDRDHSPRLIHIPAIDTGDVHDIIPPSIEPTTPVLGPTSFNPIIEEDNSTRLMKFPTLVPIFARAARVNPEMYEEWCKKALRLYDPSDDHDNLMKDPELVPTLDDENNGGGSTGAYSARDDSSSASTLPNELFFGSDPFDRYGGYEPETGPEPAASNNYNTGAEEDWTTVGKALTTPLEKTSKFSEVTSVYSQQFGHFKHVNELFLENIIQSSNDFLALDYLQQLNKRGKRRDRDKEEDGGAQEKHSIWDNLKPRTTSDVREKSPTPQARDPDIKMAPTDGLQKDLIGDPEATLLISKLDEPQHEFSGKHFDNTNTVGDSSIVKYRVQNDILPQSEILSLKPSGQRPIQTLPAHKAPPLVPLGIIITPDFAYRLGLNELEVEQNLDEVEHELEGVDIVADGHHNYHFGYQQHTGLGQHGDSSDDTSSSDSDQQQVHPVHPGLHPNLQTGAKKHRRRRKKNKWREQAEQRFRAFGRGFEKSLQKFKRNAPKRGSDSDTDGEKEKEHNISSPTENMIELRELPPRGHLQNIAENAEMEEKYAGPAPVISSEDEGNEMDSENDMEEKYPENKSKMNKDSIEELDTRKADVYFHDSQKVPSNSDASTDSEPKKKKYGRLSLNLLSRYGSNRNSTTPNIKHKEHGSESRHSIESEEDHRAVVINTGEEEANKGVGDETIAEHT